MLTVKDQTEDLTSGVEKLQDHKDLLKTLIAQFVKQNKRLEAKIPKEEVEPLPPVDIVPVDPVPKQEEDPAVPFGFTIEYLTYVLHKLWSAIFPK